MNAKCCYHSSFDDGRKVGGGELSVSTLDLTRRQETFLSDFLKSGPRSHDTSALTLRRPTVSSSLNQRKGGTKPKTRKQDARHTLFDTTDSPSVHSQSWSHEIHLQWEYEGRVVLSIPL